jgi:hypothetical protein
MRRFSEPLADAKFYIYNLGFWDLFPKLEGRKYPLTQTMAIELGILAAIVLVSCCFDRDGIRDEEKTARALMSRSAGQYNSVCSTCCRSE